MSSDEGQKEKQTGSSYHAKKVIVRGVEGFLGAVFCVCEEGDSLYEGWIVGDSFVSQVFM